MQHMPKQLAATGLCKFCDPMVSKDEFSDLPSARLQYW